MLIFTNASGACMLGANSASQADTPERCIRWPFGRRMMHTDNTLVEVTPNAESCMHMQQSQAGDPIGVANMSA